MAKGPLTARFVAHERALRRGLRLRWPLRVQFRRGLLQEDRHFGVTYPVLDATRKRWEMVVEIDDGLDEQVAIDTLLHEIAHVVSWCSDKDHHGPAWGKAYAKCYRICLRQGGKRCK